MYSVRDSPTRRAFASIAASTSSGTSRIKMSAIRRLMISLDITTRDPLRWTSRVDGRSGHSSRLTTPAAVGYQGGLRRPGYGVKNGRFWNGSESKGKSATVSSASFSSALQRHDVAWSAIHNGNCGVKYLQIKAVRADDRGVMPTCGKHDRGIDYIGRPSGATKDSCSTGPSVGQGLD